jgi:hypothetical protein
VDGSEGRDELQTNKLRQFESALWTEVRDQRKIVKMNLERNVEIQS